MNWLLIFDNEYWTQQTNYQSVFKGGVKSEYGTPVRIPTRLAQLQKSIVRLPHRLKGRPLQFPQS